MRMFKKSSMVLFFIPFLILGVAADERPVTVSPGGVSGMNQVDVNCPTFSWSAVSWAAAYQVAVFEHPVSNREFNYQEMKASADPLIEQTIRGNALSWTPPSELGLRDGTGYVWFVKAVDGSGAGIWSSGRQFRVNISVKFDRIIHQIKRGLKDSGLSDDVLRELFQNLKKKDQQKILNEKNPETSETLIQAMPLVKGSENDGQYNVYYGDHAGDSLTTTGKYNSFFGYYAGYDTSVGDYNTFIGHLAGNYNTIGSANTYIGSEAGYFNTTSPNTFIGYKAGYDCTSGNYNTYIGYGTGAYSFSGCYNIFLGYSAGYNESGSHKLYIENSNSSSPLIYGEFNNDIVCINGKLGVGSSNYTPAHEVDVDGYVKTKYFMQRSVAPQMRWYETDGPDPSDFFKMNYHASALEFIWYDASSATTYFPIKMEGDGYVGINNTNPSHMLDVGTSGAYCNGGAWVDGSSIEFKENVRNLSVEDAQITLDGLNPVIYNYKQDKEEEYLGFIAEEVPELVAMKDRKGLSAMDVVSILTKVVQDLKNKIDEQNEMNKDLLKRIESLEEGK
jgi:hypothetical protein